MMHPGKIMLTFGTRPEAIKMAPLILALQKTEDFEPIVCVTGQHRHMLDQVLSLFEIRPDLDLSIMRDGQDLTDITNNVLIGMREAFDKFKPDMVLVHGDTSTTMATSLAAFYAKIPLGHVEAGLRSHNITVPFPEEFNRRITSLVAALHFAPTSWARDQLLAEGLPDENIIVTGNTIIDSLHFILNSLENDMKRRHAVEKTLKDRLSFDFHTEKFVLMTGHRRENFGSGFENICKAIKLLAEQYSTVRFVYPVHLNPRVKKPVYEHLSNIANVHLIEPLGYEPFLWLLKHCLLVLTDSGGIQEEGPDLGKPVLVMREVTERPEGVEAGVVKLVGTDSNRIVEETSLLIEDHSIYTQMSQTVNPYGDGNACTRIINSLREVRF